MDDGTTISSSHPLKRQRAFDHDLGNAPTPLHDEYTVAWICALHIEMAAARAMLDKTHGDLPRQDNDSNTYTLGSIKDHNIVIACLPTSQYGTNNAANVLTHLIRTFPSIHLALMVGIGGGVPLNADIRLGDIVVGTKVIQHDLGKLVGDKQIQPTAIPRTLQPFLGTAISTLQSKHELSPFQVSSILGERFQGRPEYGRPSSPDRLFQAAYDHEPATPTCDGCDQSKLVLRGRRVSNDPMIHYGAIASGNQVIRHGITRDDIAGRLHVICFEMEAAGLMDLLPCLPIRGICDYSDSHKNKKWQRYAALTAAAYASELLDVLPVAEAHSKAIYVPKRHKIGFEQNNQCHANPRSQERHFMVPFGRNREFVGREAILLQLLEKTPPSADGDDCQRIAIEGLGGVGKTQIALEAVFRVRDEYPDCSVFWVPAVDATSFENAYRGIGRQLKVNGIDEAKADVGILVKTALSESTSSWLLVIDNADDVESLFGDAKTASLAKWLPFNRNGSIVFTTRNHEVTVGLDIPTSNVFTVGEMSRDESIKMLQRNIKESQAPDFEHATSLLDFLVDLPLAIKQASAYMAKTGISTAKYLEYCRSSDKRLIKLLSKDFEDRGRYEKIMNPVATTWLISFEHISRDNKLAAEYLRFMCFLAEKGVPASLLPPADEEFEDDEIERDEAIGILKAYAFVSERSESNLFDMHRLVRLAMRNWIEKEKRLGECVTLVVRRLAIVFPRPLHENRDRWLKYLPHGQTALDLSEAVDDDEAKSRLLFNIGVCLYLLGKYQQAEKAHRAGLQLRQKAMGAEHTDTLSSMNSLANVLQRQGRYWQAEEMHQQTLELRQKVLGQQHPDTLASMNNLALLFINQGKYEGGERLHRRTLELRQAVLGKEHPDTLASMHNLTHLLDGKERYEEVEQTCRQILDLMARANGKEHPDTLMSMNSLANILQRQDRSQEAEDLHRQTLELRQKVLGPDHPDTLASMNNLALLFDSRGMYDEAEQLHRQTLELRQTVLGKEHPDTLASMKNLSCTLQHPSPLSQKTLSPGASPSNIFFQPSPSTAYRSRPTGPPPPPSAPQQFGHGAPNSFRFTYSSCTGRKKALLIGINYFDQRGQLRGCINDVRNMAVYLSEDFGYKREDIRILTDDQGPICQPTKQNILHAMGWLVKDAQPNDSLFFHYSGHGGQAKNLDGDEEDSFNEVIYPVDFRQAGHISDDEMQHIMVNPLLPGVRLTALFDSCHSGTALNLPYIYSTQGILKEPNLAKVAGQGLLGVISAYSQGDLGDVSSNVLSFIKKAANGDGARDPMAKTSRADVILLSGSKDDQASSDGATGGMSWAFVSALKKNSQQSYIQLLHSVRDELATRYAQKPQLSCSHPLDTNLPFIM
ncbi:caspase domain-containing protein [Thelonectria olida]|uniref:Caspase domain-containing protein n=1 Tax=Thelonectria olida TaxID=1576542 RepID=A0A9P8VYI5_9HYPO|nr:caspase domain-containing protein [Thelonectria olida]